MPAIENHPLRIARLAAGLTTQKLADELGISRGTVTAIEEGRIRKVRPGYIEHLARANNSSPEVLGRYFASWKERYERDRAAVGPDRLSPRARAVLQLHPDLVRRYPSFSAWRREFSKSTAGFASAIMASTTSLARYERGEVDALPKSLVRAFTRTLGMSPEYLEAVMELPVEQRAAPPRSRRKKEAPSAEQLQREVDVVRADLEQRRAAAYAAAGALDEVSE